MSRGFEHVSLEHKKYGQKVTVLGQEQVFYPEVTLPTRNDPGSAGYDFYAPVDVTILPGKQEVIWTNVKAHMEEDEVMSIVVRSSIGIKQGLQLANQLGVIDSTYYSNQDNDGNIGICLKNTTGQAKVLKAGERIAQGIFTKYLTVDNDEPLNLVRAGGIGSSGK